MQHTNPSSTEREAPAKTLSGTGGRPRDSEAGESKSFHWPDIISRRYRLQRVLGRGGRSVVVAAESVDGEPVAVKLPLLKGCNVDPTNSHHILANEGILLSRLSHPGIVSVREFGSDGSYIVLELLSEHPLSGRFRTQRATIGEALFITAKLASALAKMHNSGVVHLDLKPRNILTRSAPVVEPVIIDLGSGRPLDKAVGPGTISPRKLGSGKYLFNAPEQILGGIQHFTPATDAFALGAVLYWLLTGDFPYSNSSATHSSAWAGYRAEYVNAMIVCEQLGLPPSALHFLRQALAVDREVRPQCLSDVAAVLQSCEDSL